MMGPSQLANQFMATKEKKTNWNEDDGEEDENLVQGVAGSQGVGKIDRRCQCWHVVHRLPI